MYNMHTLLHGLYGASWSFFPNVANICIIIEPGRSEKPNHHHISDRFQVFWTIDLACACIRGWLVGYFLLFLLFFSLYIKRRPRMIRRFHRSAWLSEKVVPIGSGIGRRKEGKIWRMNIPPRPLSPFFLDFYSYLVLLVGTACIDNNRVVVG